MTNTNKPRNAAEALAQAHRYERARQIIKDGYTFAQDAETQMVAVCKPGELHASYWIGEHVDGTNGCDCADKVKTGKPCKHEIAWQILKAEAQQTMRLEEEAASMEAQCREFEAERARLETALIPELLPAPFDVPADSTRTTTAQFLEALQARMMADLNMKRLRHVNRSWRSYADYNAEANRLQTALEVVGEYWGKEVAGRLNLQPVQACSDCGCKPGVCACGTYEEPTFQNEVL